MNIIIEHANFSDLKQVAKLFDAYRQFYKQKSDETKAFAFLKERTEHQQSILFIAKNIDSDEILGFTQLYPVFSSISMERSYILNDLFVHPDFRKLKIADRLVQKAKDYCIFMKGKGLELSTASDNLIAQGLYNKHGFVKEESFWTYFWKS
ncbi:MAG: GNAT family N-acetyltransferase [Leptospira sp.]|nr:GNAT family N-acetyltransferase [Leptospira sp.]